MTRGRELSLRRAFIKEALKAAGKPRLFCSVQYAPGETWMPLGLMAQQHPPTAKATTKAARKRAETALARETAHRKPTKSAPEWWDRP